MRRITSSYGIEYIKHSIPPAVSQNSELTFFITVKNVGSKVWKKDTFYLACYLNNEVRAYGFLASDMLESGHIQTLFVTLQVPSNPGKYLMKLDMVEQNVTYFETEGCLPFEVLIDVLPQEVMTSIRVAARLRLNKFLKKDWHLIKMSFFLHTYRLLLFLLNTSSKKPVLKKIKLLNSDISSFERHMRHSMLASFPSKLILDTTTKCNLQCYFCFRQHSEEENFRLNVDMSPAVLERIIEQLFPTAETVMISIAGEPLLSPHIDRIVKAAAEFNVGIHLTTNGTLLGQKGFIDRILPALACVEISCDSLSPELFETLRCGARLKDIIENARQLGRVRKLTTEPFHFGLSMTLFKQNIHELPDMVKVLHELGGSFLRGTFGIIFNAEDRDSSLAFYPETYNHFHEKAHSAAIRYGVGLDLPKPFVGSVHDHNINKDLCNFLYEGTRIYNNGSMAACLRSDTPVIIDFMRRGFRSCWNDKEMKSLRARHMTEHSHPSCRDCYVIKTDRNTVQNRKQFLMYLK